jgi:protein O-GlcNAc transferase
VKAPKSSKDLLESAQAQHRAGRTKDAESLYRRVISRNPEHEPALFALSVLYLETGRFEDASRYLERLVARRPHEPVLLTNLGEAYRRQGKLERAAEAFERILVEHPEFPEAHQNLGIVLMDAGAPRDALSHLERAAELRPGSARFRVTLAWVLLVLERVEESAEQARRAVELEPSLAFAHSHLGNALADLGDKSGAIASYRRAVELDPSDYRAHSNLILVALTDPSYDTARLAGEARGWAKLHAEPLRAFVRPHDGDRDPERPLRVGYVSPDFRAHPVRQFFTPLLAHHDRAAFEIHLYSNVERPDFATEEYRSELGERFHDIRRLDDPSAAELVRRHGIDLLVDLAVHGTGHRLRLFACKPAPVQLTWLGYAGTTGLDTIDYRITDRYFDPPGSDLSLYTETSLHLPESFWTYDAVEPELSVGRLPALGAGFFTFGCLNSYRKVHPAALSLWGRVLRQVPRSRLALLSADLPRVRRELEAAGIDPERVDFGGRVSRREYLERYHRIDLALDTFPFGGGTTSLDAVWMGVPVVTLAGGPTLQRAGTGIFENLGLPELVAESEDDFVRKSAELAQDLERLSRLRGELRSRLAASPLGDAPRFARHLEALYRSAWRRYCAAG